MQKIAGSFRDQSGFVFLDQGILHRSIAPSYFIHYDALMTSGLYKKLVEKQLLIPHEENIALWSNNERTITPTLIPFISYPHEWSFSQLKDAALLTLEILKTSLEHGMILKDASAYNVQFFNGKPTFIDTLSFEIYKEGTPWVAYKQFCEHFLAPLALMAYTDIRLGSLLKSSITGVPIDLAARLLPFKTYASLSLLLHIHLHAYAQKKYAKKATKETTTKTMSHTQLYGLIDNLESGIKNCSYNPVDTEWANYYEDDSYNQTGFADKKRIVSEFLSLAKPKTTWDIGANDGTFSRLAADASELVLSLDYDPACVEKNYLTIKKSNSSKLLPLIMDITNPSSGIGWNNTERASLTARPHPDCILALAVVHHLCITHTIPLTYIAEFFAQTTTWLIIEFIPKADKKVQTLLQNKADIFDGYTQQSFEAIFQKKFTILSTESVKESLRTLYLMKKKF